jgi:tripartite-type tricarboxylate transporter receptor subunit TctC
MNNGLKIAAALLGLALTAAAASAQPSPAQPWPTRPIKVIIPFSAGSATDTMSRPVLEQLSKQLGQPIVVENRPGGGGTVGMGAVAHSEPDGYTLLVFSNSFTVVPSTYKNPGFDTERDFVGVSPMASLPMAVVTAPSKGYASIKDFIDKAKLKPGTANYASAGTGGATHLGAARLMMSSGVDAVHVPYKGSADALRDVLTGLVDFYLCPVGVALPLVEDKKLSALAVASSQRSAAMPDLPTTVEAGFPASDYNVWVGMFAPAATPQPIVERLHGEIVKALQSPEIKATYQKLAAEPMVVSLKQFNDTIRDEIKMNAGLVKALALPVN